MRNRILQSVAVLAFAVAAPAQAAHLSVTKIDKAADGATYTFALTVDAGTTAEAGDFLTVYNFFGLVDGSVKAPEGWEFTSEQFGKTPTLNGYPLVLPVDVPGTPNITLTCKTPVKGGGQALAFTAETRVSKTVVGMYAAQVTRPAEAGAVMAGPVAGEKPDAMLAKEARIGRITLPDFRAEVESGLKK